MKTSRLYRFVICRTVVQRNPKTGEGISADLELSAIDATDAERRAADLFAHEEGVVATYIVRRAAR